VVRAESRQVAVGPEGHEALVPEELAVPVVGQIAQPGFVRDQKSALQLDPRVIDRGVEPAALALLRLKVGSHREAYWREPDELARQHRPGSVRHDQDRAVDLLWGSPDARELALNGGLPALTLGDQLEDEQVRDDDGKDDEANDRQLQRRHDLVRPSRRVGPWLR